MAKVAGVDVLLKVKTGVGTYTAIGGQKSASLSRSANTIDTTDKNSNGWAESMAGVKSWSIDCDTFVVLGDTSLEALFTAFEARTAIDVTIRIGADNDSAGYTYTGSAVITDFPEDYPQDDAVSISLSLQGASPLARTTGTVAAAINVTPTITNPTISGFTLGLSPAVLGLNDTHLVIRNQAGTILTPTSVSTANSGATYTVAVILPAGQVATVTIGKAGYNFGYMKVIIVA